MSINIQKTYKGKSTILNPNTFEREGYDFEGWNTERDGSGILYLDGQTVEYGFDVNPTNLYAQWRKKKQLIGLYANGGHFNLSLDGIHFFKEQMTDGNTMAGCTVFVDYYLTNNFSDSGSLIIMNVDDRTEKKEYKFNPRVSKMSYVQLNDTVYTAHQNDTIDVGVENSCWLTTAGYVLYESRPTYISRFISSCKHGYIDSDQKEIDTNLYINNISSTNPGILYPTIFDDKIYGLYITKVRISIVPNNFSDPNDIIFTPSYYNNTYVLKDNNDNIYYPQGSVLPVWDDGTIG